MKNPLDPGEHVDPALLRVAAVQYRREGKMLAALQAYDQLIGLGAADAVIWRETGNTLLEVREYAQAIPAFQESLQLDDSCAEAHNNLSKAFYQLGDLDAALSHARRASSLTDSLAPWLNLATMLPGCPQAMQADIYVARSTLANKLVEQSESAHRPRSTSRPRNRRLRVGYVSSFFHAANYMKPVWGLINHHDRKLLDVHLFSDSPPEKGMSGYRPHTHDQLHATSSYSNAELAEQVLDCEIDILVDLNAYSSLERLGLFVILNSSRPITVAWFNAYATTGLPGMQYIVGDEEVVRSDEESYFSEKIERLPLSYLTFDVRHPVPPLVPPPCAQNNPFTYGSLVAQYKITGPVFDAWSEILRQVPDARLLLANTALKSPHNRDYVQQQFSRRGISSDRLVLLGPAEHFRYLQYYDQIDVALDAFPYNGGTTTMEALWQGVPLATFDGDRWASRTSSSLIRQSPFRDWVAADVTGYMTWAVQMATSRDRIKWLSEHRRTARDRLANSSVCDTPRLARSMEAVFRRLVKDG